ncbi:MAG: AMP-binding protein [Nitrospinota bacterium]
MRSLLPPKDQWPILVDEGVDELRHYPDRLNAAVELLDKRVRAGDGDRPVLYFKDHAWTYGALWDRANRIARVLVEDLDFLPGGRVLLRGPNNPMMVACWFAVLKAGGVCVTTMPLLRAKELAYVIDRARIRHAFCDVTLAEEMERAKERCAPLESLLYFTASGEGGDPAAQLDATAAAKPSGFDNADTAADDPAIIAFTSGTTGQPKGTVHFHRDLLACTDCFPRYVHRIGPDDIFCGSPPLGFTFGLGALVLFPMRFGASSVMIERPSPEAIFEAIERYRVTGLYTAPTLYRVLTGMLKDHDVSSLRSCVSAGEHLPRSTWEAWREATGIQIIDGIGSTEMLHIFISASGDDIRPGSTGRAVPGYQAKVVDENGDEAPRGEQGRLAVIGPTGCRYLDDAERQRAYVQNGWNLTGDIYTQDEDGYFWYVARGDDMIISGGYNISGPEVESCLLDHAKVKECAVVAAPDPDRGNIVKAFVVLHDEAEGNPEPVRELQDFVKGQIAPYKYPRAIEFVADLPTTPPGPLQRFKLREGR